jgi:hypothetical protein
MYKVPSFARRSMQHNDTEAIAGVLAPKRENGWDLWQKANG